MKNRFQSLHKLNSREPKKAIKTNCRVFSCETGNKRKIIVINELEFLKIIAAFYVHNRGSVVVYLVTRLRLHGR